MSNHVSEFFIEKMWEHKKNTCPGLCMICPKCGGSSVSWCACARHNFRPTYRDIEAARAQFGPPSREERESLERAELVAAKERAELQEKEEEERVRRNSLLSEDLRKLREQIRRK
jgi:hypothetical protein